MSVMVSESTSLAATAVRCVPARVEPTPVSVREAIAARIALVPRRDENILIDLGDGEQIMVDLSTGTMGHALSTASEPTIALRIAPRYLSRILNGTLEPRSALLSGSMKFTGRVESGVRLLDELGGKRFPRQETFTDVPAPSPTTDTVLARRQLQEYGFCIVSGALPPAQLKALRTRLDDQAEAERLAGVAYLDGGRAASKERRGYRGDDEVDEASADEVVPNQRIWCLQNKGDEFIDVLNNPVIDDIVIPYLEDDHPQAAIYSANIVGGGGEAQFLHQDQSGVHPTTPFAIGVNIIFCLDDFTEENGATRILPGSHIAERGLAPDNIYTIQGTVPAEAPAGSCILTDTRIWHGTGASRSISRRRAVICLMQRSWTRGASNGVLAVHPSVLEAMPDKIKAMFGHRVTDGLGAIQTEPEGTMVAWDPDQLVLKMHAGSTSIAG
jgi:ectoine hydroxylase-related dioxygenase (phytanoyl-CoA dioxygenase family)